MSYRELACSKVVAGWTVCSVIRFDLKLSINWKTLFSFSDHDQPINLSASSPVWIPTNQLNTFLCQLGSALSSDNQWNWTAIQCWKDAERKETNAYGTLIRQS